MFDVNVRLPCAVRSRVKVLKSAHMINAVTHWPSPVTNFEYYADVLWKASEVVCESSMEATGKDMETLEHCVTETLLVRLILLWQ